jgi:7-cyano-7-deazaguanine synthase
MTRTSPDAVVILSGGMDSAVLLAHVLKTGKGVQALSVDYGQRHRIELQYAEAIAAHFGVPWNCAHLAGLRPLLAGSSQTSDAIPVPHGHYTERSMEQTVVPNRNMILLAVAGAHAMSLGATEVAYAAHAGDHAIYPDCRPGFVDVLEQAFALAHFFPIRIGRPFIHWTKATICEYGGRLGVPFDLTYSCYEGHPVHHCGECGTCVERREAFRLAGITDPTVYRGGNS